MKVITIGIAGGTGSGKTTLAHNIVSHFGKEITLICHDDYYKAHDELSYAERAQLNYDHPDAFDTPLLISHLEALRRGEPIEAPVYDYTVHNRSRSTRTVEPTKVVLLEGILIFDCPEIRELLDMKIFVDTDADVRILRRILRDVQERGRTMESVISQYIGTVKPMHEAFVEPSKKHADLIVPEGGNNPVAYETIIGRIEQILSR